MTTHRTLTLRELNRTTLARQLLLERASLPVSAAVERLVGLQAQLALSPYVGLWTRLRDFRRDSLARLIEDRTILKATLMRATLHLFSAADYLLLRRTLQPALDSVSESVKKQSGAAFDLEAVIAAARRYIAEQPRTFAEISTMLAKLMPDTDVGAMRYTVRTQLPLVQVPISDGWSYPGNPGFALAESWLGQPILEEDNLRTLIFRYLAAFGPATVTDIQKWSGLHKLKPVIEKLKPDLVTYRDEQGRELLDRPGEPLLDGAVPAPVRFLPEFDNLLLAHDKRTRVIADEYRSKVYLPGLRVRATFLVDGFVGGGWMVERKKGAATFVIEPFVSLTKQDRAALIDEAEGLLQFIEADAKTYAVRVVD
jgi:hypothetical protein